MTEKAKSHLWTKDEVKKVLDLWESNTFEAIVEKLGVTRNQLTYVVNQMKKSGFKFTRKHKTGMLQVMLKDLKAELNIE